MIKLSPLFDKKKYCDTIHKYVIPDNSICKYAYVIVTIKEIINDTSITNILPDYEKASTNQLWEIHLKNKYPSSDVIEKAKEIIDEWITMDYNDLKEKYEKLKKLRNDLISKLENIGSNLNSMKDINGEIRKNGITAIDPVIEADSYFRICRACNTFITYYSDFCKSEVKLNNFIVESTKSMVCPYCNILYIYNRGKKSSTELDHFYPKIEFPMFAICFYNLIPSCKTCNNSKGDKYDEIISPYDEESYNDIIFSINLQSCSTDKIESYDVILESDYAKKNIDIFHLKDAYDNHRDYIREIVVKSQIYNNESSQALITKAFKQSSLSKEDILNFYLGNYVNPDDYNKRSLSKLTGDLFRQINPNYKK